MRRRLGIALLLCALLLPACSRSTDSAKNTYPIQQIASSKFPVGITSISVIDTQRATPANKWQQGAPNREIELRIWYPAVAPSQDQAKDDDFSSVTDGTPMFLAPPAAGEGPFKVILFAHGLGATPADYGDLLAAWASVGFVVVAPRFPLSSGESPGQPDANDVVNQPGDIAFVLSELQRLSSSPDGREITGLLDLSRVGISGHSLGGMTTVGSTAANCCRLKNFDAAMVIAGSAQFFPANNMTWSETPPLMVVHGKKDAVVSYEAGKSVYDNAATPKYLVTLQNGDHSSFLIRSDPAFLALAKTTIDFWLGYLNGDNAARNAIATNANPPKVVIEASL